MLGLHGFVARFTAEGDGFGVVIGTVATDGGAEEPDDATEDEACEDFSIASATELDGEGSRDPIFFGVGELGVATFFDDDTCDCDTGAEEHEAWGYDIGKDPHVGIGMMSEQFDSGEE